MTLQISPSKDAEASGEDIILNNTGRHQISDPSLSSRQSASGKAVFTSQSRIVQTAAPAEQPASRHLNGGGAHTVAERQSQSHINIILIHSNTQWRSHLLQTGAHITAAFIFSLSAVRSATILHTLIYVCALSINYFAPRDRETARPLRKAAASLARSAAAKRLFYRQCWF